MSIKGEAPRCKLCGGYISRWCDYLDCPHVPGGACSVSIEVSAA